MSRILNGGDLIGQGSYGCVFKPGLMCNGKPPSNNKISKLMIKKEAIKEINELKKIDKIDKEFIFHIETPKICDISKNDYINEPGIENCNIIRKTNRRDSLVNLEYNYGGITLKELLERNLINSEKLIKTYFTNFENLFYGLYQMNKNNFMHNDIKDENIVIHPKDLKIKYIDFGLSRNINKNLSEFEINIYKYGYFAYPFETFLLNEEVYNHYKYGSSKNIDIFNSMKLEYEFGFTPYINRKYISGYYKLYETTWLNDKREYIELIKNTNYEEFKNELLKKLDIFSLGLVLMKSYYHIFNEKIDLTNIKSKKDNLLKYHLLELINAMTDSFYKERISAKEALRYYRVNIIPLVSDIIITKSSMKEPSKTLKKRCPEGKVLNPKTNRCVNKTGKIGKGILRKN